MEIYQHKFKKSFGQNYLTDEAILKRIALFAGSKSDFILEIGTGMGSLTLELAKLSKEVITYEIDASLNKYLEELFQNKNIKYINKDFLKEDLSFLKNKSFDVVANVPYYITTDIVKYFFDNDIIPLNMTLLVQKELASRWLLEAGNKDYGYINVLIRHFYDIEKGFLINKTYFKPQPKVDSMLIKLKGKKRIALDYNAYKEFLKASFSSKRKKLKNNLEKIGINNFKEIADELKIKEDVRAEDLPPETFEKLFEIYLKHLS